MILISPWMGVVFTGDTLVQQLNDLDREFMKVNQQILLRLQDVEIIL